MWSLRQVAHSLRKQGYCFGACRVFSAKSDTVSNVKGGRDSICNPMQLISDGHLPSKEFYYTPSVHKEFFVGGRRLCSQAGATSDMDDDVEDGFSEPEKSATPDIIEASNALEEDGEKSILEQELLGDLSEKGVSNEDSQEKGASLELLKAIMETPGHSVLSVLNKWVEEGNDLGRDGISVITVGLRKCRMYGKALQFSEWLESSNQVDLTEHDYAFRLDLIAKAQGILKAEKYAENIPESFRTELIYRTLLRNYVILVNMKKAEAVFKKMRELGLPITVFACNQMIILYRRLDRKRIADTLLLMEKENIKPSLSTYTLLVDAKGESNDIMGMEQLVETMKAEGIEPDIYVLALTAKHYVARGFKSKALTVLKEIEDGNLGRSVGARILLLSIYASLGRVDDVGRIWKDCESDPKLDEGLAAIDAWGKLGKVEEAEAVFDKMLQKWTKLSSRHYSALLKVYVNHKLVNKGKDFVKRIDDDCGSSVGPLTWDAIVKLYVEADDLEKANSILRKAAQQTRVRPLFNTFIIVMEQYAKRGDIHNTEKLFHRMKQRGYTGRLKPFEVLFQAYINAKVPAYGFRQRMKAENIFPNKAFAAKLAQADAFRKTALSDLLD